MTPAEVEASIRAQIEGVVREAEFLGKHQQALVQGLLRAGNALKELSAGLAEADNAACFVAESKSRDSILVTLALIERRFPRLVQTMEQIRHKIAAHEARDALQRASTSAGGEA
jgi:hypothetical protein